jgi:hypothetical protein
MDYELAKSLKAAGFPQNASEKYWLYDDEGQHLVDAGETHNYRWEVKFAAPTLEELIEACGDQFIKLTKDQTGWLALAQEWSSGSTEYPETVGATPCEAVARLYLALNAKTA